MSARAVAVLVFALLVLAPSASATVTVSTDGEIVVLTSDNATNSTDLELAGDTLTILNRGGSPGIRLGTSHDGCEVDPSLPDSRVICTVFTLDATYGAGDDEINFINVCLFSAVIRLGNGSNEYSGQGCADGLGNPFHSEISITAGSGHDIITGSFAADTDTQEHVLAGGGDDEVLGGAGDDALHGEGGNDTVEGGDGNDLVNGEDGDDILRGRDGNDTEDGGPGNDRIGAGINSDDDLGADDLRGGDGTDSLEFFGHPGAVSVSTNEIADDGSPGEGDNVHSDFETISGSSAGDTFTGGPGPDGFEGGAGNDTIHGGGGPDTLKGDSGDDQVFGDDGADQVYGGANNDQVDGGPGQDLVFGDIEACCFTGGSDQLFVRDGEVDRANCGPGPDTIEADDGDVISSDALAACEAIDRSPPPPGPLPPGPPPPGPPPPGPPGVAPTFSPTGKATRGKGVGVTVTCAAACTFKVSLTIPKKVAKKAKIGRTLGKTSGRLLAAGSKKVRVKVSKKAMRKLKRKKKVKATLKVVVTDAAGAATTLTKSVTLKR